MPIARAFRAVPAVCPRSCSVQRLALAGLALAAAVSWACGSKGDPLPPLRLVPAKAEALSAARVEGQPIRLRFVVPAANQSGGGPVDIGAVRIFALTKPATDPPPAAAEIVASGTRIGEIAIPPVSAEPLQRTDTPALPAPAPGAIVTWEDTAAIVPTPLPMVRYYAVAGVSRRNRIGAASDIVAVPLSALPDAPRTLSLSFTEGAIKLDWLAAAVTPDTRYRVYEVTGGRAADVPLNAEPLATTTFEDARLEFGTERCYLVRAVRVSGSSSLESGAAGPVCITPKDIFPPPAPANLSAVAATGAISLIWDAVESPDLAGYLILRAEAPGDKLQPLFEKPIAETTFRDTTAAAGTRYVYAVIAVDKTGNRGAESNRVEETGRN